jgi:hypothetical protein
VDAQVSVALKKKKKKKKKGVSKLQTELEPAEPESQLPTQPVPETSNLNPSPVQKFRSSRKVLSVADLLPSTWYGSIRSSGITINDLVYCNRCELQFDYDLRQERFRKAKHRPDSFTSGSGKEIAIDREVAAVRDQNSKGGTVRNDFFCF